MSAPLSLTLFSTCKPFTGESARIQTNALRSWAQLRPAPKVIIFGDESGVAERCREVGFTQVLEVARSEYGTPLLNGLFTAADRVASTELVSYVNADIILMNDLFPAVEAVSNRFPRFLLIARRWNLNLDESLDFKTPDWEYNLRTVLSETASLEPVYGGVDLFVYPRGLWDRLPPFAIGRGRWDSALIYHARKLEVPVVDATEVVTCVHQNHDYAYHPQAGYGVFKGPEAATNLELLGGEEFVFTPLNATHVLRKSGCRRKITFYPPYVLRRLATMPALYPSLQPVVPIIRRLAPWWRRIRRALHRRAEANWVRTRHSEFPYPISITSRRNYPDALPEGGGVEAFDTAEAHDINHARIEHLRSLNLPVKGKTVLDVGCGVGHLAQFFVQEGCDVLCVDGRKENIDRLHTIYPYLKAQVLDLEQGRVSDLGRFDVVFCYGLLYHLENPFRAIRDLASACKELLILETMVVDHHLPVILMKEETAAYSQALRGIGSRPSPSAVVLALREVGFRCVYAPKVAPEHRDFRNRWKDNLGDSRDGHPLRAIFIASRTRLRGRPLISLLEPF